MSQKEIERLADEAVKVFYGRTRTNMPMAVWEVLRKAGLANSPNARKLASDVSSVLGRRSAKSRTKIASRNPADSWINQRKVMDALGVVAERGGDPDD